MLKYCFFINYAMQVISLYDARYVARLGLCCENFPAFNQLREMCCMCSICFSVSGTELVLS